MSRTPLTDAEIAHSLQNLKGWYVEAGKLTLRKDLSTFLDAVAFVQQVALIAESLDHHPDIDLRWRTVILAVNTHDAGNAITGMDVELARQVDGL